MASRARSIRTRAQSFMWSDRADEAYKRLTRTIDGPGGRRDAVVLDELQPRARLRLHDRRGPHGRPGQLDDAAGRERSHVERPDQRSGVHGRLEQSRRRGQRAAPVPAALPDVRSGDGTCSSTPAPTGEWNAANGSSSGWQQFQIDLPAYAGPAGRDLDHRAERLGLPAVPGRVHRRHRGLDRRGQHVVRGRRRSDGRLDRPRRAPGRRAGSRDRTATTGSAAAASGSRRARPWRPPDTLYLGFGLEGITGAATRATR